MKKDLLLLKDLSKTDFDGIFALAARLKKEPYHEYLLNKSIGLLFTKSSTRTRVSFEVGVSQLGGRSLFLSNQDIQLGRGETIEDTARVLSRYLDAVIIRTYDHQDIKLFALNSDIPVINGLTDLAHPCQVLTDLFTIIEKRGSYENMKVVFYGDCANNMAYSWMSAAAKLGFSLVLSGHEDFLPAKKTYSSFKKQAEKKCGLIEIVSDPLKAAVKADVIYTDVWTSMGQEKEQEERLKKLAPWQVNDKVLKKAAKKAIFLHCLPAHRGEEVSADVIDGNHSVVFDQAENRLHVQKAIMAKLIAKNEVK